MEFTLQAFVVTGVNSARSSPPLRGIFPPRGELPSREASSPANILAGTTQTNKVLRVDAKSIMGIFALNLARELTVDSPTLSEEELHKKFAAFLAG